MTLRDHPGTLKLLRDAFWIAALVILSGYWAPALMRWADVKVIQEQKELRGCEEKK